MTIKEFAYSTQQHLHASAKGPFKRAHIYELLAASFGFNSYAALCANSVFTDVSMPSQLPAKHRSRVRNRCIEMGYPADVADAAGVMRSGYRGWPGPWYGGVRRPEPRLPDRA